MTEQEFAPGLYLVATPLGHLGDLSPRAREVLSRASVLACESRQVGMRWLELLADDFPHGVRPQLVSYREGSRDKDAQKIVARLQAGDSVALISDAGTPTISDPGWHLVDQVRSLGLPVTSIPGPCAAVTALSLAGFPCRRFCFEGFLPASGRHRRETLARLDAEDAPVVLYESPHHLLQTLIDFSEQLRERPLFVGRELSKKFEETWRGTTADAAATWHEKRVQGEFTLVLGPHLAPAPKSSVIPAETIELVRSLGLPTKSASAIIKHFFPEAAKKELYALFLDKPKPQGTDSLS